MFEALESRVLLATVTWDGGAGTDFWHDAMNWSGDAVPNGGDDVIIDVPGEVKTITYVAHGMGPLFANSIDNHERFHMAGGSLSVSAGGDWVQREVMEMSSGTVNADIFFKTGFEWSGGTIRDRTVIEESAYGIISDHVILYDGGLLVNFGDLSWIAGDIEINGGMLNNRGTLTVTSDGDAQGGPGFFANNGVMIRRNADVAHTETVIKARFVNDGVLTLESGDLRFTKINDFNGGSVVVEAGSRIRIFGTHLNITRFLPSVTLSGAGAMTLDGGTKQFLAAALDGFGEIIIKNGAVVSLNGAGGTLGRLDIDGAELNHVCALTITHQFRFFEGYLRGDGLLTINPGGTMIVDAQGFLQQKLDLDNFGTVILKNGAWRVADVTLTNHADLDLHSGSLTSTSSDASQLLNLDGAAVTKYTNATVTIDGAAGSTCTATLDSAGTAVGLGSTVGTGVGCPSSRVPTPRLSAAAFHSASIAAWYCGLS